ncbi:CDP-diacylglycerol--serine O-phosphatidyltransferase [Erythrobacter sp. WG]|uniref:CDP-diacylglycerol--serine O-phosphatidyltransferase n=1 Tax=Erythrobacter sp. WG TaxID=2985510 RepID=UPI002270BAAD|nr:CDP-diacylglycerol--serine O-phosphatidyltransferase [Erythrobacter sp. WG]MCX9146459.1 CDP-diacylglycerol--serine O-phosphatidyltransferase [Erythrobacter sp. WG]
MSRSPQRSAGPARGRRKLPGARFLPARLGPKAAEDEDETEGRGAAAPGLSLRAMLPNAVTAAALCSGLTGIRFATEAQWGYAIGLVVLAGVLDGIDGRVARLLNAQSRFGAELDSLADSLSFGVAPALILFMWSLQGWPTMGWLAALAFAICCALRLARFNARIDVDDQPHKSAGFLTGVPAPVGAGLAFLPFYLWQETGIAWLRDPVLMALWLTVIAILMISNMATLSWASLRPPRSIRLPLIAVTGLAFAALILQPWWTLAVICAGYLALMPWGLVKYGRIKRRRRLEAAAAGKGA